jgi:long-chain fatty acid transport protein
MKVCRFLKISLLLTVVLASQPVLGSTFDIFGYNPRGMGLGGALGGGSTDYTAAYYNPAALTSEKKVNLGLGISLTAPLLFVDRSMPDSEHPTVLPEGHGGLNFGWKYPVGGILQEKVALGVSLHLPFGRLLRVQGFDPTSPQFYLYQNLHDKLLLVAAAAYEPVPWLSVGVGVQVLANLSGSADLRLDIIDSTFESAEAEVDVLPSAGPILALHSRILPWLQLGFTYRGTTSLLFELPVGVHVSDALALDIAVTQTVLWSPEQFVFGAFLEVEDWDLGIGVDLTFSRWSQAPDPSTRLAIDFQGKLVEDTGLGEALDVSTDDLPVDLQFVDTLTPRLGMEWKPLDFLTVRGGYFFRPTPAPRASGTAMYLDNHAHVFSLGLGFIIPDQLQIGAGPVELDLALQTTLLARRTVLREVQNDPVGSLSHGGALVTGSVSCSYRY